jgi:hypothetical protein
MNNYSSSNQLPIKLIQRINRLPSIRKRGLDIIKLLEQNEVFVLNDKEGNFLQCIFYKVFDNFVYMHSTIGKDEYKDEAFKRLFNIVTRLGPCYCIMFNSPKSIECIEKYGGIRIRNNSLDNLDDDLFHSINQHTRRFFYREGGLLYDKSDSIKVENPFFCITQNTYDKAINTIGQPQTKLSKLLVRYNSKLKENYITCSPQGSEISEIYETLVYPLLGRDILPPEKIKSFQDRNNNVLKIGRIRNSAEMSFFYCFLPMNEKMFHFLKEGKREVFELNEDDIEIRSTKFAYFAGGGALSVRDRAAGLLNCANEINRYSHLLSKPVSNEGLTFLQKTGFEPVSGESKLGVLHFLNVDNSM